MTSTQSKTTKTLGILRILENAGRWRILGISALLALALSLTLGSSPAGAESVETGQLTYKAGTWYFSDSLGGGGADLKFRYGKRGDTPLTGDWNGDGNETPAIFRGNTFYLKNSKSGGKADVKFRYGKSSDEPVAGDWDGDGKDTVGVVRGNRWLLKNSNGGGGADIGFRYGKPSDEPVVGDWDGDTGDAAGLVRGNRWLLKNSNGGGGADIGFRYGKPSDEPVVGDWNGDGEDTAGLVRGNRWLLENSLSGGEADTTFRYGGESATPLVYEGTVQASAPASRSIALGASVQGFPGDGSRVDDYSRLTGGKPEFVNIFHTFSTKYERKSGAFYQKLSRRGITPMLTWMPATYDDQRNPEYALDTIVNGDHDAYIRSYARGVESFGKPFYLRFAHEMNGDWFGWGIGVNGNTARDYRQAWRHVHGIFEQEGAENVRWVWSPNEVSPGDGATYRELYPGDAYVDWLSIDVYNWGYGNGGNRSFEEMVRPSYREITALSNKPVMLPEFAAAEQNVNKGAWIRNGLGEQLVEDFPKIKAAGWFNHDKERDWRVNSSRGSLDAYRGIVGSPDFDGRLR